MYRDYSIKYLKKTQALYINQVLNGYMYKANCVVKTFLFLKFELQKNPIESNQRFE